MGVYIMKDLYLKPITEIIEFDAEDVIVTSADSPFNEGGEVDFSEFG